jgi:hypothetical protein
MFNFFNPDSIHEMNHSLLSNDEFCLHCLLNKGDSVENFVDCFDNLVFNSDDGEHYLQFLSHITNLLKDHGLTRMICGKDIKDLRKELLKVKFVKHLVSVLKYKPKDKNLEKKIFIYNTLEVLIRLLDIPIHEANKDDIEFKGESGLINQHFAKDLLTENGLDILIELIMENKFLEKIKALHLLRKLMWYGPASKKFSKMLQNDNKIIDVIINMFIKPNLILKEAYKNGFEEYELKIISIGVEGNKSVQMMNYKELSEESAFQRISSRLLAVKEATLSVFSALFKYNENNEIKNLYIDYGLIDYVIEFMKIPFHPTKYEDLGLGLGIFLNYFAKNNKKGIEHILSKGFFEISRTLMYDSFFNYQKYILDILLQTIKFNKNYIKKVTEDDLYLISIINSTLARYSRREALSLLLEISSFDYQSCSKLMKYLTKEFLAEMIVNTEDDIKEIVVKILINFNEISSSYNNFQLQIRNLLVFEGDETKAIEEKETGNNYFKNKDYKKAIEHYSSGNINIKERNKISLRLCPRAPFIYWIVRCIVYQQSRMLYKIK